MSDSSGEGGTKIQRRNVQQIPVQQMSNQMPIQQMNGGGPDPRMMQQQMGGGQQMSKEEMMMMQQRQQMMMQQQQQQQMQQVQQQQMASHYAMDKQIPKGILKTGSYNKENFNFSFNNVNVKNSIIVVVIFILLNSRIIWRALSRIPMMGTVEPSILALVVNSLIAGIVFYFVTTKLSK